MGRASNRHGTLVQYVALIVATVAVGAGGSTAIGGIQGSEHDFSATGWAQGQICVPCHAPHNASTSFRAVPLWNHAVTTATYKVYTSESTIQIPGEPGVLSKACLSCHDGTIALDAYGGATTGSNYLTGPANLGTDLSDDHPVGVLWAHQTTASGAGAPPCSNCHAAHGMGGGMKNPGPVYFYSRRVECPTCHNVHNRANLPRMLVKSNARSALCLHCHGR